MVPKLLRRQVPAQDAATGQRDLAGLLGHDDDVRVGLLGEAERGPVPGPQRPVAEGVLREREMDAGSHDLPVAHDDRPIVEGRPGREQRHEQAGRHIGPEARPRLLDVLFERQFTFDRDDRPRPGAGQFRRRLRDLIRDRLAPLLQPGQRAQHAAAADPGERVPQLGVKDDDEREGAVGEGLRENRPDEVEAEPSRRRVDRREEDEAEQHLERPRAGPEDEHPVDEDRDDGDLEDVQKIDLQEAQVVPESVHHLRPPAARGRADGRAPRTTPGRRASIAPSTSSA